MCFSWLSVTLPSYPNTRGNEYLVLGCYAYLVPVVLNPSRFRADRLVSFFQGLPVGTTPKTTKHIDAH
jgi:hypothetical protein